MVKGGEKEREKSIVYTSFFYSFGFCKNQINISTYAFASTKCNFIL